MFSQCNYVPFFKCIIHSHYSCFFHYPEWNPRIYISHMVVIKIIKFNSLSYQIGARCRLALPFKIPYMQYGFYQGNPSSETSVAHQPSTSRYIGRRRSWRESAASRRRASFRDITGVLSTWVCRPGLRCVSSQFADRSLRILAWEKRDDVAIAACAVRPFPSAAR